MPVVSTKLSEAEVKFLKNEAEAGGYSLAAYVRRQLRSSIIPKDAGSTTPKPLLHKDATAPSAELPLGRVRRIIGDE